MMTGSSNMLQYGDIVYDTIVDGDGLRNTLYLSGCKHNCLGCHNPSLQNFNYGKNDNIVNIAKFLTINENDITFSGGEPFEQAKVLGELVDAINLIDGKRNYWIYSGYTFEQLIIDKDKFNLLSKCDVLVDSKFEIENFKQGLRFKGSTNQRIIDVQSSLKQNKIVLWK